MSIMETVNSVEEFCRLCLGQGTHYVPLFENNNAEMLESLTSIKINFDDPAPNLTCFKCLVEMKCAYKTQQRLIKTEKFLQEKISSVIKEEKEEITTDLNQLEDDVKIKIENEEAQPEKQDFKETQPEKQGFEETDDSMKKNQGNWVEEYDRLFGCPIRLQNAETKQCLMCPKVVSLNELKQHYQNHDSGYCEYCGKQMKTAHSLRNHVRRWHKHPKITCDQCGDVLDNRQEFDLHMRRIHTNDPSHICYICGGKFFNVSSLNRHFKYKHSDEKPFNCSGCSLTFATKSYLKIHERKHSDEMLFVCEFCGKTFKFKCNMNMHKKSVHGWKSGDDFRCGLCKSGFPSKMSLNMHISRVHNK